MAAGHVLQGINGSCIHYEKWCLQDGELEEGKYYVELPNTTSYAEHETGTTSVNSEIAGLPQIEDGVTFGILGDPNNCKNSKEDRPLSHDKIEPQQGFNAECQVIAPHSHLSRAHPQEVNTDIGESLLPQEPSLLISAVHGSHNACLIGTDSDTGIPGHAKSSPHQNALDKPKLLHFPAGHVLVASDGVVRSDVWYTAKVSFPENGALNIYQVAGCYV